jgi:hypothetical protein
MVSLARVADDERRGRRLGDETKSRIADLAAGWTVVDGDASPDAEPANPEPHRPPRRKAKTVPPPPPGSPERRALEDKIRELRENLAPDERAAPPPDSGPRRTGQAPVAGKPRRAREPLDLAALPESERTKENRGAVAGSLTTNATSGTIGGDTPPPIFDRAAIAAGSSGAIASERLRERSGPVRAAPADPMIARGTPSAIADRLPPRPASPAPAAPPARPSPAPGQDRIRDPDPEHGPPTRPPVAAPIGEPGRGQTSLEPDPPRPRLPPATGARELLGRSEPARATVAPPSLDLVLAEGTARLRDDATSHDRSASSTGRFERGDPTPGEAQPERGDATTLSPPPPSRGAAAGSLRAPAALPRVRGISGDLRYVGTVVLGLRAARRELAGIEARQATRQQSRRHHLVILGRTAATTAFEHPALSAARALLATVEDERSQHAGDVAAADAELLRVRRDRDLGAARFVTELAALDASLVALARQREPLDKDARSIKKRAAALRDALAKIDDKIAATEASLTSARAGKLDRATIQAELATLRADRNAIQSDEPGLAGELDMLNPRIAAVEAARADAVRARAEQARAEHDDQHRAEELLAAIGARRKVVDRATAEADARRDKILFGLGEQLYVDRPATLAGQLAPIDEIDLELASADRRAMELREILSSVDRWKLARGVALLVATLGGLATLTTWLLGWVS